MLIRIDKVVLLLWALSVTASAATITGTVKNGTTGKPAVGDDVVLLKLQSGMEEGARTTTDKAGHYKLTADGNGPFLIRVEHDHVNYHKPAPPGTTTADVDVYDANAAPGDITGTVYDMAIEASNGSITVQEVYAVNNQSNPPRTYNPDLSLKLVLPQGAQVVDSMVSGPGGMPIKSAPVPAGKPGEYGFAYPIRPGATTFSVLYRLPYSGKMSFDPKPQYSFQHFAVEAPKSMNFTPAVESLRTMPEKDGVVALLASNVKAGDTLKFDVAGTGDFPRDQQAGGDAAQGGDNSADNGSPRPGGGIGQPEGTPDPLNKYRWYILGGLAVVLAGGAVYVVKRPTASAQSNAAPATAVPHSSNGSAPRAYSGLIIEALKEELFQLEVDQHQGRINKTEYERVKAALDVVIARAIQRGGKTANS